MHKTNKFYWRAGRKTQKFWISKPRSQYRCESIYSAHRVYPPLTPKMSGVLITLGITHTTIDAIIFKTYHHSLLFQKILPSYVGLKVRWTKTKGFGRNSFQ